MPSKRRIVPFVAKAFALHARPDADLLHQIDRALLEHAGPDRGLDGLAAAGLQNDRLDALQVQDVGQHQPRRAGTDDGYLSFHGDVSL